MNSGIWRTPPRERLPGRWDELAVLSIGPQWYAVHRSGALIRPCRDTYFLRGRCPVPARSVVQSPVMVGRDAFLAIVESRLAGAAAGSGQLLFVAGEAGIGKTRLLGAIARQAHASGFAV